MTAPVGQAPAKKEETQESKIQPSDYSCQIILEKTTEEKATDKSFPTDAYIVRYVENGTQGSLKAIDFGHGTIKPSQYGYKSPDKKKRKRKL